jgi:hypothetical protein
MKLSKYRMKKFLKILEKEYEKEMKEFRRYTRDNQHGLANLSYGAAWNLAFAIRNLKDIFEVST